MVEQNTRDGVNMADDQEKSGRCKWLAMGGVAFLLYGILPGTFIAGMAALTGVNAVFGRTTSLDLISRLLVPAAMIVGLLLSAIIIMVLTMAIDNLASGRRTLFPERNTDWIRNRLF